jgi:hypothetical protein
MADSRWKRGGLDGSGGSIFNATISQAVFQLYDLKELPQDSYTCSKCNESAGLSVERVGGGYLLLKCKNRPGLRLQIDAFAPSGVVLTGEDKECGKEHGVLVTKLPLKRLAERIQPAFMHFEDPAVREKYGMP